MEQEPKNYEIAYLLSPSLPEKEVLTYAGKINTLIEDHKGAIKHIEAPKKQQLSYAIKKERNAYFGWTAFRMLAEYIAGLEKKLKSESLLLRHLIVEEEISIKATVFRMPTGKQSAHRAVSAIPREQEKTEEKLDLEALDKKLEEILGK